MSNFLWFMVGLVLFYQHVLTPAESRRHVVHEKTGPASGVFDVTDFGAAGNGRSDDTKAFSAAWEEACKASVSPTIRVPARKNFMLQPLTFSGQSCNFNTITVVIDGKLSAPSDPSAWKCDKKKCNQWIEFSRVKGLQIKGSGQIDGQGERWWDRPCHDSCGKKPTALVISHCNNVQLSQLQFLDSPQMHIAFENSNGVHVSNISVSASARSPNTDGIHIQDSANIFVDQSSIATGDDCISIGKGCKHLNITRIRCGPGHGISIGSLGKDGAYETVEYVYVSDVNFTGTTNGARIKTWQGGKGYARNIHFERIMSDGSALPIVIDQFYCDHQNCKRHASAVSVSNVTYNQVWGTSKEPTAVNFACSDSVPCRNIVLNNINLRSSRGNDVTSYCSNVVGTQSGKAIPVVHCLGQQ